MTVRRFLGRRAAAGVVITVAVALVGSSLSGISDSHAAPSVATVSVEPVGDTYASQSNPSSNYADSSSLASLGSPQVVTYMMFLVPTAPAGKHLSQVQLDIHTTTIPSAGSVSPHQIRLGADEWSSSYVTGQNMPDYNGPSLGVINNAINPNSDYSANLDVRVISARAGSYTTLTVSSAGSDSLWFYSRNFGYAPDRPHLVFTFADNAPATTTSTSTTVPPPANQAGLAFAMPSTATLRASDKKVFAHYFTPFTISRDNKPAASDTYANAWLNPMGENGKYAAVGGFLRDRPEPRATLAGDFRLKDMQTDIREATGAGIDGFAMDVFSYSTSTDPNVNWNLDVTMMKAAEQTDSGFKIMLQPDMAGTPWDGDTLAMAMSKLAASPAAYRLSDGRLVISPFEAEKQTPAWWANWMTTMKTNYGINVALVPCFLNLPANASAFGPISYGFSSWGNRSPATNTVAKLDGNKEISDSLGKLYMQPVSVQDERPRSAVFDEANNTENLRSTWLGAITNDVGWVLIPTWNDFSEGAQLEPTVAHGSSFLDLSAYYAVKYKTGLFPVLKRDAMVLSHRIQKADAKPTYPETKLMTLRAGSSPARDTVESLTMLSAPGAVTVKVGSNTYIYDAPAGLYAKTFPLATGSVSGSVARNGAVVTAVSSPFKVTASPYVQDLQYYAVSSLR